MGEIDDGALALFKRVVEIWTVAQHVKHQISALHKHARSAVVDQASEDLFISFLANISFLDAEIASISKVDLERIASRAPDDAWKCLSDCLSALCNGTIAMNRAAEQERPGDGFRTYPRSPARLSAM